MEHEILAERFKLNITVLSNDRCKEVTFKPSTREHGKQERGVLIWSRKRDLTDNVYVEESQSGELRAVKRVARHDKHHNQSELAVIGIITKATETHSKKLFVDFKGWFPFQNYVCFVMEYCRYGDISQCFASPLPETETKEICAQLLEALSILHSLGITHRDIKPQNVLVVQKSPIQVKLADFGVSKLTQENTELRTRIGSNGYIAPEIYGLLDNMKESSSYTSAVDMWSLGCLLYYVLTKLTPFSTFLMLQHYINGQLSFPEMPLYEKGVSIDGRSYIRRLLRPLPESRPKASDGLLTEWIIPMNGDRSPEPLHNPEVIIKSLSAPVREEIDSHGQGQRVKDFDSTIKSRSSEPEMDFLSLELWTMVKQENTHHGEQRLRILLDDGANPNILHMGHTSLHLAVMSGPKAKAVRWVKILLDYGARMDILDGYGHTVLHSAIQGIMWKSGCEKLQLLLDRGVDVNVKDKNGDHPFVQMISVTSFPHASTINVSERSTDSIPMFESLLDHGVSLESDLGKGFTPLFVACIHKNIPLMKVLVRRGASLNPIADNGETILHPAAYNFPDNEDVFRFLLEHGCDPNTRSSEGTPLHFAVQKRGNLEAVKLLLKYGARVNEEDDNKRTPLMRAAEHKFNNIVISYLIMHGAKGDTGSLDVRRRVQRAQFWHNLTGKLRFGD